VRVESQGFVDKKRGRPLYGRSRAYFRVNGRDLFYLESKICTQLFYELEISMR